jgi:hypothetical protein
MQKDEIFTVSHTSIQDYLSCRRYYALRNITKVQIRKRPVYFIIGTACHAFIEAWHEERGMDACIKALRDTFSKEDKSMLSADELVDFAIEQARAEAMMMGYIAMYEKDKKVYTTHLMEKKADIMLTDSIKYKGYLDHLAKDGAGDWWIVERKTSAKGFVNADFFNRVMVDNQVMGYMELAKELLGVYPKGILYDVILKTQHSQRQTETLAAFLRRLTDLYVKDGKKEGLYVRQELLVPLSRVESWKKEITIVAEEMRLAMASGTKTWPKNSGNCIGKYGSCMYLPICVSGKIDSVRYKRG